MERSLSLPENDFFKNIRVYRIAFITYLGIFLFGYDTGIAGGVVSNPYFLSQFGLVDANGKTDVAKSNAVSSNVVSVLQAGAFFGALGSAPISAKIGRRYTLLVFVILFMVGAILTTVAHAGDKGLSEIYTGRVISGIGTGGISVVAPVYVSECAPKGVRGRITGLFQIMVAIGVMISYFINYGIGIHISNDERIWRIPFGFQLVPAGLMALGLLTLKESPRYLASRGYHTEALSNLAYLRRLPPSSEAVLYEMAEINAAIKEEQEARRGLGWKEAFFGKGNWPRFGIAFTIFLLQQWSGQNSVNYYTPQIFASIGYTGTRNSLLATGIYGVMKVVATTTFVFFGVETLGRKKALFISAIGMGTMFFIVGAILKTHPPPTTNSNSAPPQGPSEASKAMAAMLYIYACFWSMGWGPVPWIYCSDIFPTRTRHYGLAVASGSQWLWNFVLSKVTPDIVTNLGYKLFLMFATVNVGAMGAFSLLIPETKGRSLEEMDIIFGAVNVEERRAYIEAQEKELDRHAEDDVRASDEKV